jgi:hypothetical protein
LGGIVRDIFAEQEEDEEGSHKASKKGSKSRETEKIEDKPKKHTMDAFVQRGTIARPFEWEGNPSGKDYFQIKFSHSPAAKRDNRTYYLAARVDGKTIAVNDVAQIEADDPSSPHQLGRVMYMWESGKSKMAHVKYFWKAERK